MGQVYDQGGEEINFVPDEKSILAFRRKSFNKYFGFSDFAGLSTIFVHHLQNLVLRRNSTCYYQLALCDEEFVKLVKFDVNDATPRMPLLQERNNSLNNEDFYDDAGYDAAEEYSKTYPLPEVSP